MLNGHSFALSPLGHRACSIEALQVLRHASIISTWHGRGLYGLSLQGDLQDGDPKASSASMDAPMQPSCGRETLESQKEQVVSWDLIDSSKPLRFDLRRIETLLEFSEQSEGGNGAQSQRGVLVTHSRVRVQPLAHVGSHSPRSFLSRHHVISLAVRRKQWGEVLRGVLVDR